MQHYHYPDTDDRLVITFLSELEKNEPYWAESERDINGYILDYFKSIHGYQWNGFLDAGCGKGRLIGIFAPLFRQTVAIEPDAGRYASARALVADLPYNGKVRVKNVSAESYNSSERFGFILCSHVIQHIHTDTVLPLMRNLRDHLDDNGVIALTTCHSIHDRDYFGKNHVKDGLLLRETVDREEFNALVHASGMLPIHYFHADGLITQLGSIGLKTVGFRVFHVSREDREALKNKDIDQWVNADPALQHKYGVDMCLLLTRA